MGKQILIAYMHNPVQMLCLVSVYKGQCLCLRCDYVACVTCHICHVVYFLYSVAVLCYCICCICEGVSWICTVSGASGEPEVLQVQGAQWWVCKSHPRPSGSEEELSS